MPMHRPTCSLEGDKSSDIFKRRCSDVALWALDHGFSSLSILEQIAQATASITPIPYRVGLKAKTEGGFWHVAHGTSKRLLVLFLMLIHHIWGLGWTARHFFYDIDWICMAFSTVTL